MHGELVHETACMHLRTCSLATIEVGLPTIHGTPSSNKLILRSLATTGALAKLEPSGICPQQMAGGLRVS